MARSLLILTSRSALALGALYRIISKSTTRNQAGDLELMLGRQFCSKNIRPPNQVELPYRSAILSLL